MPEAVLYRSNIVTVGEKMRCETVPETMAPDLLTNVGKRQRFFKGFSDTASVQVVAPDSYRPGIVSQRS